MPDIQKVSVALTGEQVAALKEAVETGEYATTSEIVREALREWQWSRELREQKTAQLRAMWDEGKASGISNLTSEENLEVARKRVKSRRGKAA